MNEYKSVAKYLSNKKEITPDKKRGFIKYFLIKIMSCIIILLSLLIILRYDKNNKQVLYKFIYETNFNFAYLNNLYTKYLGDILPFQAKNSSSVKSVFNEELNYKNLSIYKDGISLEVEDSYLIPVLEDGVVIFMGEKEEYGQTIIIEGQDGINIWYSNLSNINVNLYDYVKKGEFLACSSGTNFYLLFQKEGKFINYKDYL